MTPFMVGVLGVLLAALLAFRFGLASKSYQRRKAYRDMLTAALGSLENGKTIDLRVIQDETRKIREDVVLWKRWTVNPTYRSLGYCNQNYKNQGVEDLSRLIESAKTAAQSEERIAFLLKLLRWCAK